MHADLLPAQAFSQARTRIAGTVTRTPLLSFRAPGLPGELWLKDEGAQPIGSFKLRGAANKVLSAPPELRAPGVITYSSGNHAQGVAYAARAVGVPAVIVMPSNTPPIKRAATAALGGQIVTVGPASSERRAQAEALAARHGYLMVPPYDDPAVKARHGNSGLENI